MPERVDVSTAPDVEKALTQFVRAKKPDRLVCDFSETLYVSSAGLRVMLVVARLMKGIGGEFVLCGMQEPVRNIFKLAGLCGMMSIRDSVE